MYSGKKFEGIYGLVFLAALPLITGCDGESHETHEASVEEHLAAQSLSSSILEPSEPAHSTELEASLEIEQVEPPIGSTRGEILHIYGNHFVQGIQVSLGGTPCGEVQVHSSTHLECHTRSTRPKVVHVILTNPSGQKAVLEYGFEFANMSLSSMPDVAQSNSQATVSSISTLSHSAPHTPPGKSTEASAPPIEKILVRNSSDRREMAHQLLAILSNALEKNPLNLAHWASAVETRTAARTQAIQALRYEREYYGEQSESIMRNKVTQAYLESISRLEARYPFAVPNAQAALREIYQNVEQFDVNSHGAIGVSKKEAALRYLDRVVTHHASDPQFSYNFREIPLYDPHQSGLTYTETLALIWAAINDRSVFVSDMDFQDRKWGFLDNLAHIQRAHNDSSGSVSFDLNHEQDQPSCGKGTFKRILESLDGIHPDVRINESPRVTNQMAFGAIKAVHQLLFAQESPGIQQRIRLSLENQGEEYQKYVERLKIEVRKTAPNISAEQIEINTNSFAMEALFAL